ncbi:hypothetical protein [Acinetobacter indicus]|uniref:hypothetical protein n=1 Tax=Acinetobacter indicus TaxID=756892 RepID=UPI002575B07B|nr:hypothetical protein [Acinetobacter indicus]
MDGIDRPVPMPMQVDLFNASLICINDFAAFIFKVEAQSGTEIALQKLVQIVQFRFTEKLEWFAIR